jgi:predicted DNA-binding protein (MmcQ/YjbR family)
MTFDAFYNYCSSFPGVREGFPFGEETLVFYVCDKMFALASVQSFETVNLKCDPELAEQLRENYEEVQPGYHMNKKHWNTVRMDGRLTDAFLLDLIRQSYDLVVAGLPKKVRASLEEIKKG